MKKILFPFFFMASLAQAQLTPTPDVLWGPLFNDVQLKRALGDNKTFVDMVPQFAPPFILKKYAQLQNKDSASLRSFVLQHFYLPAAQPTRITEGLSLNDHLHELWNSLSRKADTVHKWSSLLPLPYPYIVPGGRFREIYYWDSYFTMLGLAVSNRWDLVEEMVKNFSFLIQRHGHIPNGNRNYYLSRSQPPFFALMVDLLQQQNGDAVYKAFFPAMEKEYRFWMKGKAELKTATARQRVVKLPDGSFLNRYWDDSNKPRQESYAEDWATAKNYQGQDGLVYRHLRGAAESGWDFSSRWFEDTLHLTTIETASIIPVDLNALLYACETILSRAAAATGNPAKEKQYKKLAQQRKAALIKYCWRTDEGFFFDYDWKQKHTTGKWSLAGLMPLFTALATPEQAGAVSKNAEEKFLMAGGVVTTLFHTGQQWDAPNGWAPLQYITVKGLMNYGFSDLAKTIAERWMQLNEKVFSATGKMMEKYNVENLSLESGGGEYPTQDGFGWTNGVYLKFHQLFRTGKTRL